MNMLTYVHECISRGKGLSYHENGKFQYILRTPMGKNCLWEKKVAVSGNI